MTIRPPRSSGYSIAARCDRVHVRPHGAARVLLVQDVVDHRVEDQPHRLGEVEDLGERQHIGGDAPATASARGADPSIPPPAKFAATVIRGV
jgi:hypothetical protein